MSFHGLYLSYLNHISNMLIELSITEALVRQKELIKQMKRLQNKIIIQGAKEFLSTSQIKELQDLIEERVLLGNNLIQNKTAIRDAVTLNTAERIFKLSECKEQLKCFEVIQDTVKNSTTSKINLDTNINNLKSEISEIESYLTSYNKTTVTLEIVEPKMEKLKSNI